MVLTPFKQIGNLSEVITVGGDAIMTDYGERVTIQGAPAANRRSHGGGRQRGPYVRGVCDTTAPICEALLG